MDAVLRVVLIYGFVMFALRVMGKREFSQLSPVELVTLLLIPEIVSQGILREDQSLTNSIISVSALLVLVFITSMITHLSPFAEKVINSPPTVLVHKGQLIADHLNRERVSASELLSEIHKAGLTEVGQVEWAILQSDGVIAIIPVNQASATGEADKNMPTL
ncbi:MAG: DUF421 domain-containing protein [Anaerolineae bacterium]|jgi:uncharacterized membrane protein YcaP (DUF421 family)|nr:DUF421 domain-containing protein [Anaerolineae bacterium]